MRILQLAIDRVLGLSATITIDWQHQYSPVRGDADVICPLPNILQHVIKPKFIEYPYPLDEMEQ